MSSMLLYISIVLSVISAGMDYNDDDDDVIIVEPHKSILTCSPSDMEDQYHNGKCIDRCFFVVLAGDSCCRTHKLKTRLKLSRRNQSCPQP